jgi:hypothetical protein
LAFAGSAIGSLKNTAKIVEMNREANMGTSRKRGHRHISVAKE